MAYARAGPRCLADLFEPSKTSGRGEAGVVAEDLVEVQFRGGLADQLAETGVPPSKASVGGGPDRAVGIVAGQAPGFDQGGQPAG